MRIVTLLPALLPFLACTTALAQRLKIGVPPPAPPPSVPAELASMVKLTLLTSATTEPVGLAAIPGEKVGRLFVVEKGGLVRILRGQKIDPVPFLDLSARVRLEGRPNGEQGLLGLAFSPAFRANGFFYVNFTDRKGDTRVVEMRVDRTNPDRADATFERELLFVDQPYSNHNGGHLAFGPDGKLYVGLGDGGSANDPQGNGQKPTTHLGKILRITPDKHEPVVEVVAKGLRNPWRYSFDRKAGDLYVADVGQNVYEWIHVLPTNRLTGENLGWNITEGLHCFLDKPCSFEGLTRPVIEYPHSEGCSITGGHVYRGKALPELAGHYFYSDYCTAFVRSLRMSNGKAVDSWEWKQALDPEAQLARIAAFGEDQEGELYLVSHDGPLFKLTRR
jgi:glucose/arabinose dehydrogenase